MIPMTPRGIRILPTRSPLGRLHMEVTFPTGSGRAATSSSPRAMARMAFSSSVRRSIMAFERPFLRAYSTSFSFSSMRVSV
jgi:hypothetical protein